MKHRYLEVTFRKGVALAAYLYLPRAAGTIATSTIDGGCGMRVDLDEQGDPIGVEITAPSMVTVTQLNELLSNYGAEPLASEEWAPLAAA
jgi:uncharacterized protein YuzE